MVNLKPGGLYSFKRHISLFGETRAYFKKEHCFAGYFFDNSYLNLPTNTPFMFLSLKKEGKDTPIPYYIITIIFGDKKCFLQISERDLNSIVEYKYEK